MGSGPRVSSPVELANAHSAELTGDGWVGLTRKAGGDLATIQPLVLVWSKAGGAVERLELPFSGAAAAGGGTPYLVEANLRERRFVYATGTQPKIRLQVWDKQDVGDAVEGSFALHGGSAVSKTQALVALGKMDPNGFVDRPTGPRAARFRNGAWAFVDLPKSPEKDWTDCFYDAAARPQSDEMIVLQICTAPGRELAYAVYRLAADSDQPVRIPFDNSVFEPGAARGEFSVEDDGTIDLGVTVTGREGAVTLARLRGGGRKWHVVRLNMPARLLSSVGVYRDRLLFTDGGSDVRESSDGGKTFRKIEPFGVEPGMVGRCNGWGCTFKSRDRVVFRRW